MKDVRVLTSHPIAAGSVDHLHPRGTRNDSSTSPAFNRKLLHLRSDPRVLDLGCAGGGFVASLCDAGIEAIGIEGSDYSKRLGRAAWATHSDALFTADIGEPFLVMSGRRLVAFDVVTLWEVLEHLSRDALDVLCLNVLAHLLPEALLIASINTRSDQMDGIEYHATIRSPAWWESFWIERGFEPLPAIADYFAPDWVRGPNTEGDASTCFVFQRPS